MVAFDAVVRVLRGVVKGRGHQPFDSGPKCWGPIGHDLDRLTMRAERSTEEPSCRSEIASRRNEHVDDLAVLINGPVDVPPPARHLHVGLIHEPTVTDSMAIRSGRIREQWRGLCCVDSDQAAVNRIPVSFRVQIV